MIARLEQELDVPVRYTDTLPCHFRVGSQRYYLSWWTHPDVRIRTLWVSESGPGLRGIFDARSDLDRQVCEILAAFQGQLDGASFYGFGVGLDLEAHRRICELTGEQGQLTHVGTHLVLGDIVYVTVPHPFFQEKGMEVTAQLRGVCTDGSLAFRGHLVKLRRYAGMIELLERAFG